MKTTGWKGAAMGFVLSLMKIIHYFGLFMGGGAVFGGIVIGLAARDAPAEHRPTLIAMARRLKAISHSALALLIASGILLATLMGTGVTQSAWFWVKMVAVGLLIAGVIMAGTAGARALQGEAGAARQAARLRMMNLGVIVVILIAAVLAFG